MTIDLTQTPRACFVEPDESCVVRHAAPIDDRARRQMLEQQIARMVAQAQGTR